MGKRIVEDLFQHPVDPVGDFLLGAGPQQLFGGLVKDLNLFLSFPEVLLPLLALGDVQPAPYDFFTVPSGSVIGTWMRR